jgi:DNA polymerase-4
VSRLEALLGSWGVRARELASGHDLRSVDPHREAQSIGAEVTHERDLTSAEDIRRALLEHAGRVAQRLLEAGLSARCVTVKLKDSRFQLRSRRVLLPEPVADTGSIYRAATGLLLAFPPSTIGVRLTGVSLSHLELGPPPPGLFPDEAKRKRARLEGVIADVGSRLGVSLTRAALLDPAGPKRE